MAGGLTRPIQTPTIMSLLEAKASSSYLHFEMCVVSIALLNVSVLSTSR